MATKLFVLLALCMGATALITLALWRFPRIVAGTGITTLLLITVPVPVLPHEAQFATVSPACEPTLLELRGTKGEQQSTRLVLGCRVDSQVHVWDDICEKIRSFSEEEVQESLDQEDLEIVYVHPRHRVSTLRYLQYLRDSLERKESGSSCGPALSLSPWNIFQNLMRSLSK